MILIDTILNTISGVIDKVIPDANIREQLKSQVMSNALDWYKMDSADRESARKREVDTKDSTTKQLSWVYTVGYFCILSVLLSGYVNIPSNLLSVFDVLLGVLTAGQYSIMTYYFGSSSGSSRKDTIIQQAVGKLE